MESYTNNQHHQSGYTTADDHNYLKESLFSNRYHVIAGGGGGGGGCAIAGGNNFQFLSNKLQQQSTPFFDYHWLSTQHTLQNSFLVEREKNFARIEQWLAYQHEYSGHPPPDEECRSCSSLVDAHSPVDDFHDYLPRYKSEELIQTTAKERDESSGFRGIEVKRRFSPNINRRRYSPRSDPTLNKTSVSSYHNQFSHDNIYEGVQRSDHPTPLNYYFYQAGKGNTFPRRSRLAIDRSENQVVRRRLPMGQQLERHRPLSYDERVMPNPYATTEELINLNEKQSRRQKQRPVSMLEGRSFILNGISMKGSKQGSVAVEKGSMFGNMSLDAQRLLTGGNLPDVALVAAKAIHKRELSDSLPKGNLPKQTPSHFRVSSAPETTQFHEKRQPSENSSENDNNCVNKVQIRKSRIPSSIRKVKAFSWPKRAVLPDDSKSVETKSNHSRDESFSPSKRKTPTFQRGIVESGYNTENTKSEEILEQPLREMNIELHEDEKAHSFVESDVSDIPPERPPLPPTHSVGGKCGRAGAHEHKYHSITSISEYTDRKHAEFSEMRKPDNEYSEPIAIKRRESYHTDGFHHSCPRDRYSSYASACSCNSPTNDLSKTVSMSLKDLIRIHEQEIARVSAGFSTTSVNKSDLMRQKSRNSSSSDQSKNHNLNSWKRHTTIGLVTTNYSLDHFQEEEIQDQHQFFSHHLKEHSDSESHNLDEHYQTEDDIFIAKSDNGKNDCCDQPSVDVSSKMDVSNEIVKSNPTTKSHKPVSISSEAPLSPLSKTQNGTWPLVASKSKSHHNQQAPKPLPKPKKTNTVIIEPSFINVNSAREQFANLTSPNVNHEKLEKNPDDRALLEQGREDVTTRLLVSDGHQQTCSYDDSRKHQDITIPEDRRKSWTEGLKYSQEISSSDLLVGQQKTLDGHQMTSTTQLSSHQLLCKQDACLQTEEHDLSQDSDKQLLQNLTQKMEDMKLEFNTEREELLRKLEEQKKVANAYQKLEDRYRKKVCTLKKLMRNCTCHELKGRDGVVLTRHSLPLAADQHSDISVQKVDNILHQLEAWLNHQTGGIPTDTSEVSSLLGGSINGDAYPRYKLKQDYYSSPPLEILDQIDATSV